METKRTEHSEIGLTQMNSIAYYNMSLPKWTTVDVRHTCKWPINILRLSYLKKKTNKQKTEMNEPTLSFNYLIVFAHLNNWPFDAVPFAKMQNAHPPHFTNASAAYMLFNADAQCSDHLQQTQLTENIAENVKLHN